MRPSLAILALLLSLGAARADEGNAVGRKLQSLLHAHQAEVFDCVAKQARDPKGELLVRIYVGERGEVAQADVLKAEEGAASLQGCLLAAVRKWDVSTLGASAGDQIVFPFSFRPHREVVRGIDVRALPIAGGGGTAKIMLDGMGAPIALERLTAAKGTKIPTHAHDASDEIVYVLSGRGTTTVGADTFKFSPGDAIFISKGTDHSLVVDEALDAIQVYSPGGPEQRFKQGPK